MYQKIADFVRFAQDSGPNNFSVEGAAAHLKISLSDLNRLFSDWIGISPTDFLTCISPNNKKDLLSPKQQTLFESSKQEKISLPVGVHAGSIKIIPLLESGREHLLIRYSYVDTTFGPVIIASTFKGVCHLMFFDDQQQALQGLRRSFPVAELRQEQDNHQQTALQPFRRDWDGQGKIHLHVQGTDFQISVWNALLQIPAGTLSTYGEIARAIGKPDASRAVGTAIGSNPVAFLIPCHRVVRASGEWGGYRWDVFRKMAMIGWEAAARVQR